MRSLRKKSAARGWLLLAATLASGASCSSDEVKPRGELMLAITTDLAIAKDMNQVGVEVFDSEGRVVGSQDLDILPTGDVALPGTLALVPPNSGGQGLRVRVTAKKLKGNTTEAKVVREAIVKVPTDRVALLRMPLHWLCSGMTKEVGKSGDETLFASDCDDDQTCKNGECVPADVDANALPDFKPGDVFGGGDAQGAGSYCLNAQQCFAGTEVLTPDADCTVPLPADADSASLNVALVLPPMTDGHCLKGPNGETDGGTCYLPLDSDPAEGFTVVGHRIQLPSAACKRLSVVGVSVSTSCRTKDLSVPVCGLWTGWPVQPSATGEGGGGGTGDISTPMGGAPATPAGGASGAGGDAGAGGSNAASCPVTAALAPAYFYVLVDTSRGMQSSLSIIRQALTDFGGEAQSAGTLFGLQLAAPVCQGDYSTPALGFAALPDVLNQLPNFSAGNQAQLQLDSAMAQTLDTLKSHKEPASRTLVVFTTATDQGCGSLTDIMHQVGSDALASGVSLRPVQVLAQGQANLASGLTTPGGPPVQQFNVANLQPSAVVNALNTFRDVLGPCTFVAPTAAKYVVSLANADGGAPTPLTPTMLASTCGQSLSYYLRDGALTLCPSACAAKGAAGIVQTDACVSGAGSSGVSASGGATGGGAASGGSSSGGTGSGGKASGGAGGAAQGLTCPDTDDPTTTQSATCTDFCSAWLGNCLGAAPGYYAGAGACLADCMKFSVPALCCRAYHVSQAPASMQCLIAEGTGPCAGK